MINPDVKESIKEGFKDWWECMATSILEDSGAVFAQLFFTIMPLTFGILTLTELPKLLKLQDQIGLILGLILTIMGGINLLTHIIGVILWIFNKRGF